ncbi:BQ2448_191 [Microbotryum intermedium]|uniref:BQ2448_191 protein n=1 Tax=Microbotryum intermedium TaxID=269621 RepID=A0A238F1S1_9BASI|nr:BQ2448_191 [Microbotryum intermedium]
MNDAVDHSGTEPGPESMSEAGSSGPTMEEDAALEADLRRASSVAVASAKADSTTTIRERIDTAGSMTKAPAHPHHTEDGTRNDRAPTKNQDEFASRKRKASGIVADESQKRGRRLFGLLQSTLKQASTSKTSEAAKKRQQLEDKLYRKLHEERKHMMDQRDRSKEARDLALAISLKEEELVRREAVVSASVQTLQICAAYCGNDPDLASPFGGCLCQMRTQHEIELDLAEFLCTAPSTSDQPGSSDMISFPNARRLASSQHFIFPDGPRPIFYLPYRLLRRQENELDDQVADIERRIKKAESDWLRLSQAASDEIDDMKERVLRLKGDDPEPKDRAHRTSHNQGFAGKEPFGSRDDEMPADDVKRDRDQSPVVDALQARAPSANHGEEEVEY